MRAIAYEKDGRLHICRPWEGARRCTMNGVVKPIFEFYGSGFDVAWIQEMEPDWAETEEEFIERIQAKDIPAGITSYIIDGSVIPQDRSDRDSWTLKTLGIE